MFLIASIACLQAQVASPHNFPHAYANYGAGNYGPSPSLLFQSMGINGHVTYAEGFNVRMVLNKNWDQYMSWNTSRLGPSTIQKNSHIWLSDSPDSRICTVDTMGTVLNQSMITGSTLIQVLADTNDHVYLVYRDNNTLNGFGVVRFGASFVLDWHFFYPGAEPVNALWGIDQRLYVTCIGRVTVLDADGNRLKDLMNVGTNYTVYQDHGLGIVSIAADSVSVIRTDSTMAVRWAKKFRPTNSLWGQPITVIKAVGTAAPGSNDMVVTATAQVTLQSTINCVYPYTEEIYTVLLDANGVLQGHQILGYPENKTQYAVTGSPFGDPMISYTIHSCLLAAHIETRYMQMVPGYNIRQACGGSAPTLISQNYTPAALPTIGALGTRTAPNLSIAPDNLNFGVYRTSSVINTGNVSCIKPCLTVTQAPLGGGQVAFSDDTYGFYTIHYDFGDGGTANTNDPVHTYPPYGTWPVTVVATNACGADTFNFTVHACTTAQVSGPASTCVGAPTTYTETSGLNSAGLSWLVNGMSMGTGSSFTWTPSVPGTYTLSTVYEDLPCRDTNSMTILVNPGLPVASFTYAVTAQRQLTFTNTSTGAVSYNWSFGDGSSSTAVHPVKTYNTTWANNGNFTICLIATNGCGSDTSCYNFNCPIPFSSFTIPSSNGLTATITNAAVNGTISWDFGDGSTATGTVASHTFPGPGTYTICQTVSNACATHSSCQSVIVDNNGASAFREILVTGYDNNVRAIAAQPNGDVLVALASSGSNAALLPLDSTGAIRGPMNTWPGSTTQIVDLHAMANGNFAFFGHSSNSGSALDPYWGEVDKMGNIVQAKYLPISTIAQSGFRSFQLPSGYFYVVNESSGPQNYYYIKLDQNLQVQYVRYNTSKIFGGLEAPDGSIWLVQQPNANSTTLEFVHLDASGVGTEKYTALVPFGGTSAYFLGTMGLGMDCDGHLYGMLSVSNSYPGTGATPRLGVFRFNTVTHDVETRLYRIGQGATANNPVQNPDIKAMVKYPNGHWIGWGTLRQSSAAPEYEKFVVDLDPATFTLSFSAYGEPGTANQEQVFDAYVAAPGYCYTVAKSGISAKPLEVHRHSSPADCQLPASVLAPQGVIEFSSTTATYSNAAISSTALTTAAANWTRTSGPATATSLLQCTGACPSGLAAAFSYSVTGNTVTLTSTSTSGAILHWSVQGQTCVADGSTTMTLALPCGNHAVTLTASDQCGAVSTAQTITVGSAAAVSIGSNQDVCPGTNATFTATAGFASYLWSNGATTASISVATPGAYSVTATDAGGCSVTASATLGNHTAPTVAISPNQTVCPGANATFTATAGFISYLWSTGATVDNITVSTPGTYDVTATDANGCTATASAALSIHSAPTIAIGPNQTVCPGANATFTATAGFSSYLWSNGATADSITVSTPGTYGVTATDGNGCTATASSILGNFPSPSFSLGGNASICMDTTWALLGPSSAISYAWSTGATTQGIAADTAGAYWLTIVDANGCTAADTIQLTVAADCVWPGDANHDGTATHVDLLAIAYGMGASSSVRPNATTSWYGQPAVDWANSLPLGSNYKHLDCDGNGTVELVDTAAIHLNFGLTHNKTGGVLGGVPAWIEPELDSFPAGDTVFFNIHWGDAGVPVTLGHGIAFSFQIDPAHVTPGTLYGRFPNSFLGNGVPELATMTIPFAGTGDVYVVISRQDQIGRSGNGAVMRVGFLPDQVLPLTATLGYIPVSLGGIVAVDGSFTPIICSPQDDSILVYNPINTLTSAHGLASCSLFPVPASDVAYLDLKLVQDADVTVAFTDMHGRQLTTVQAPTPLLAGRHRIAIPTDQLSDGVYFVRLTAGQTVKVMKLVVAK